MVNVSSDRGDRNGTTIGEYLDEGGGIESIMLCTLGLFFLACSFTTEGGKTSNWSGTPISMPLMTVI
jgi:hypothetical protein